MKDIELLTLYFKNNYSFRMLDKALGFDPKKSKGFRSFRILRKKYLVRDSDKGLLFVFNKNETNKFIKEYLKRDCKESIKSIIKNENPNLLQKYKGTSVLATDEEKLYQLLSDLSRNLTQRFFLSGKKQIKSCQYCGKSTTILDTAHIDKERPDILKTVAKKHRVKKGKSFSYPVFPILKDFLYSHSKAQSIAYLCKKHHIELDILRQKNKTKELKQMIKSIFS